MNEVTHEETTVTREQPTSNRVYQKKKGIFRADQVIWYILAIVEIVLAFRFVLKLLGANSISPFVSFIYSISAPLVYPFSTVLGTNIFGNSVFEWSVLVAALVYFVIAYILSYLLEIIYPVTPRDLETTSYS
jgi:hypothetical protein